MFGGVVATTTRSHGFDNEPAARAAAQFPGRLRSVGAIDVLAPEAPETFAYWVRERGMRGMRCFGGEAVDADSWLGDERCAAVFRRAEQLGAIISAQRTRVATLPSLIAALRPVASLRFVVYSAAAPVVGQSGRSADVGALTALASLPGCHVSVSVENARATFSEAHGYSPFFEVLCEHFGVERIAWGSYSMFAENDPRRSLATVLDEMRAGFSFLSANERAWVFGGTARQLFWD